MDHCPECDRPYGKQRYCHYCHGRQRTGTYVECAVCGEEFYVAPYQTTLRNGQERGKYCSRACKHEGQRITNGRPERVQITKEGYRLIFVPGHPRATHGRIFEHIIVAEKMLGRPLRPDERVHHKDEVKGNNDPSNLEVLTNRAHSALHGQHISEEARAKWPKSVCPECGKEFPVKPHRFNNPDARNRSTRCSKECRMTMLARVTAERHRRNREARAQAHASP